MRRSRKGAPTPGRPSVISAALAVTALAALVRLLHLYCLRDSPFFTWPVVDAREYVDLARKLAGGGVTQREPFFQAPLYPVLMALVIKVAGSAMATLRVVQALTGSVACGVVAWAGGELWGTRRAAWLAGVGAALYGPMVFFDGELLPATLQTLLYALGAGAWWRWRHGEGDAPWAALAGGALGLAMVGHGLAAVFLPAALVATLRRRVRGGWAFWAAALVPVLAVVTANSMAAGRLTGLSTNVGMNLYVGNNPDAGLTETYRPGNDWQGLFLRARRAGAMTYQDQSPFFTRQVLHFATRQPGAALLNLGRKTLQYVSGNEIMRNQSIYPYRAESPVLAVLMWKRGLAVPLGLLLPLALWSLARPGLASPQIRLLTLLSLLHALGVIAVFITARYRLPAVVFLLLMAAGAADGWLAAGRPRPRRPEVAALLLGLLLALQGVSPERTAWTADDRYVLAETQARWGAPDLALATHRETARLFPDHADTHYRLGRLLKDRGELDAAEGELRRAIDLVPDHLGAWDVLGEVLLRQSRLDDAITALTRAVEVDPTTSVPLHNLGLAYRLRGDAAAALGWFTRAAALPDAAEDTYVGLVLSAGDLRRPDEAGRAGEEGLERFPAAAGLRRLTGWNHYVFAMRRIRDSGPTPALRRHLERAAELMPDEPRAPFNIGVCHYMAGDTRTARSCFQEALRRRRSYAPAARALAIMDGDATVSGMGPPDGDPPRPEVTLSPRGIADTGN